MDLDTTTGYVPAPGATWQPGDAWLGGGTGLRITGLPDRVYLALHSARPDSA